MELRQSGASTLLPNLTNRRRRRRCRLFVSVGGGVLQFAKTFRGEILVREVRFATKGNKAASLFGKPQKADFG